MSNDFYFVGLFGSSDDEVDGADVPSESLLDDYVGGRQNNRANINMFFEHGYHGDPMPRLSYNEQSNARGLNIDNERINGLHINDNSAFNRHWADACIRELAEQREREREQERESARMKRLIELMKEEQKLPKGQINEQFIKKAQDVVDQEREKSRKTNQREQNIKDSEPVNIRKPKIKRYEE